MKIVGDFKHQNFNFYDNRDNPADYEDDFFHDMI